MKATQAQVIAALIKHDGAVYQAAEALGIAPQGLYVRIQKNPKIQQAMKDIDSKLIGKAIGVVSKKLSEDDGVTARWYLERKGRDLGFGNRVDGELKLPDDQVSQIVDALLNGEAGTIDNLKKARDALEAG